ncbi:sugar ABC transporter permease [Anaerolineales bacterium HSG6]|nr:sugar ABC transporter permease [Anaerolineales bacterium HSG6]MDM8531347.1 sugar ABC transporter permease [Anaerolineales bacterium HSG25]
MDSLTLDVVVRSISEVGGTVAFIVVGSIILELILFLIFKVILKSPHTLPIMLLGPAAFGMTVLIVYPLLWELNLSFTNMSLRRFGDKAQYTWIACQAKPENINFWLTDCLFKNYVDVFRLPVLKQVYFFPVFLRTVLWTFINMVFHLVGGTILAILLNQPIRGRGIYRTFLILPWAIPQVIAVLAWRGEFHFEYGFVNLMLVRLGLEQINWMTDPFWNFAAMCIVNIWLGIPFMMVILLGGLQSISSDYYEAAEIDGASGLQQFTNITIPLLRPVMTPAIVLGTIWTFNNFNVPFFINQFELETSDILVTALFRAAFQYNRYGFSAAFAFIIFIILLLYSIFYIWISDGLKEVYE